jgi:hypothetical protein
VGISKAPPAFFGLSIIDSFAEKVHELVKKRIDPYCIAVKKALSFIE